MNSGQPNMNDLQYEIHQTAIEKGWWKGDRNIGELLMLMVSELVEALEAYRESDGTIGQLTKPTYSYSPTEQAPSEMAVMTDENEDPYVDLGWDRFTIDQAVERGWLSKKPEGFATELADTVIRVLDTAEWLGIDLERVIREKMAYNRTRPYRHGGKLA